MVQLEVKTWCGLGCWWLALGMGKASSLRCRVQVVGLLLRWITRTSSKRARATPCKTSPVLCNE